MGHQRRCFFRNLDVSDRCPAPDPGIPARFCNRPRGHTAPVRGARDRPDQRLVPAAARAVRGLALLGVDAVHRNHDQPYRHDRVVAANGYLDHGRG